jgi:hypothetical protein
MIIGGVDFPLLENVPRAGWSIGTRPGAPRYFTAHYNGPRVPGFGYVKAEKDQIRADARYHMRPGALGAKSGGDGIQYHGGTFSDGSNWLFRSINDILWHCRNFEGNQFSISWHIPIGDGQQPTTAQIRGLYIAINAFRRQFPSIAITGVKGHKEWSTTPCPGAVMPHILDYRNSGTYGTPIQYFKTTVNANCREAPSVAAPVALGGKAITPAGTIFAVDALVRGTPYRPTGNAYIDDDVYAHRADGIGFYHISVVTSVEYRQNVPLL